MTLEMLPSDNRDKENPKETLWFRILSTALALPGAKVNRDVSRAATRCTTAAEESCTTGTMRKN